MKKQTVIGLTGQTGSGKSTVSGILRRSGFDIIDCDMLSRDITADGSDCCKRLSKHFPACFDTDLHLDRAALADIVFNDSEKLKILNALIFPFILNEIEQRINDLRSAGRQIIILDAPTLFESGADRLCNLVISCISRKEIRLERIIRRDCLTHNQAESRISAQHPENYYTERSDFIIENNGGIGALHKAADHLIYHIKGIAYGIHK